MAGNTPPFLYADLVYCDCLTKEGDALEVLTLIARTERMGVEIISLQDNHSQDQGYRILHDADLLLILRK